MHQAVHRGAFFQFFSGGFITAIVVNPPERKLAKRPSVQLSKLFKTYSSVPNRRIGPNKRAGGKILKKQ